MSRSIFKYFVTILFLICIQSAFAQPTEGTSWRKTKETGEGQIVVYWHPSNTRIGSVKDGMDGVEHEIILSFADYLEKKYNVKLSVHWIQPKSFNDVLNVVSTSENGTFGASSISITTERKEILNFTPPFFPDISVLISNAKFPIAKTRDDFSAIFRKALAVTIPNTTLEKELLLLKSGRQLDCEFEYVPNGGKILDKIENTPNSFGYIDLPNFLRSLNSHSSVKRQYFYPLKLEGLSFVFPMRSDWNEPVEDYFRSAQFQVDKHRIVTKYLGNEVTNLIERISVSVDIGPYEEIILLTEEKELQAQELLEAALREQDRQRITNWLIVGVILILLMAILLYTRYYFKSKANVALAENQRLIEQRNSQLLELNQEKNNLIRVVAHDLRNPINQMLGLSEMLLHDKSKLDDEQEKVITFILQASDRLRKMISKILDVDAIETGGRNITIEQIEVNSILTNISVLFDENAKSKHIKLEVKSAPDGLHVLADRVYFTQILENLVSNALKFSFKDTLVEVFVETSNNTVTFGVSDQGPGFTEEDQTKIFKKYQQLSAVSTAGEPSTGLGLSIVKMYTEIMNGTVTYKTEQGKGTIFYVTLPKSEKS